MTIGPKGYQMSGPTSLGALSGGLSQMMDRPVVDLTGIEGTYQVDLEWVSDGSEGAGMMAKMRGMAAAQAAAGGEAHGEASEPNGLSLNGALQEKLGLKLEARKSPVDILVVDGAEKVPTEN
jgi:uncharacterized protein (TIGR03435 family)